MVYESSYESGRLPFVPDPGRGTWASPTDFVYACIGLAFRIDVFGISWSHPDPGVPGILPSYLICLFFYVVPFMVIQSFLGQFSTSGFMSAFRVSPLFKGIGYVSLAFNIVVLTYQSIFAMIPLLYLFASLKPELPWSCDGFKKWATNLTEAEEINLCTFNSSTLNDTDFVNHHIPSALYFRSLFHDINLYHYDDVSFNMSWELILCALIVWAIIAFIFYKYSSTEMYGKIIRYSLWTLIGLIVVLVIRFSFLDGSLQVWNRFLVPSYRDFQQGVFVAPLFSLMVFGPGWGTFITLSSFNKFKTNINKYSWIIGISQLGMILGLDLLSSLTDYYFKVITEYNYYLETESYWNLYLTAGSAIATMGWANLWCILFYSMLLIGAMALMITQLHSIFTSIFDEFPSLREDKQKVTMSIIAGIAVFSLYFTSNHGITYFLALTSDGFVTQTLMNLLLILIVLWIYGRVRFQRDLEFMINQKISTFKINILRFAAPIGMLLLLVFTLFLAAIEHSLSGGLIAAIAIIFIALPWLFIPGYCLWAMRLAIGTMKERFWRCCQPTDWYPVVLEDRQKYEIAVGNTTITHQLNEVTDDVL